ncbi:MAG: serine/threonine protein kinase [Labilithrix sp.]|nr:serine/threonine protein kinase [Labilithrix sp.]
MSEAAVAASACAPMVIGRYALFDELAAGGMATVHLGRLLGPVGFGRTVAIKRLHTHYVKDQDFVTMFMDEARIVSRIRHPNVVPMVDVVQNAEGIFLIMEYVHGESLSRLMRNARKQGQRIPPRVIASIMQGVLLGLHAAHETKSVDGSLLGVVHRDVSPQNVIIGADGAARVLDFGIAKAAGRAQITREGQIKGKLAYMAPEQIRGQVDRRTDVFAAAVVLWELLAGRRLHDGAKDVDIVTRVIQGQFPNPSEHDPTISVELDALVMKGLAVDPAKRFASARELAIELERKVGIATPTEVSEWVERLAHDVLAARSTLVNAMELASASLAPIDSHPPPASFGGRAAPPPAMPPDQGIPVEVDAANVQHEPPSSSAVFAHTQTSAGEGPRTMPWGLVGVAALLATIGIALGGYALYRRSLTPQEATAPAISVASSAPKPPPPSTSSSASATPEEPSAEKEPALAPSPSSAASSRPAPSASAEASPSAQPAAGSSATPPPSASASAPAKPAFVAPVFVPPRPPPPKKPSCDPPYTVDEVGHRHYKPECD